MKRKRIALIAAATAVVLGGITAVGVANASVPPPVPAKTTVLPSGPRIVGFPGISLAAGHQIDIKVAGQTLGGFHFPANITGLTVTATVLNPASDGVLTVWTTDAGKPGTPTVSYKKGVQTTNITQIGVNSDGYISVYASTAAKFVLGALAYMAPDQITEPSCVSTIATIPAVTKTLTHVGGSIRTGATDLGSISLPAGTYDTRVVGGWTGLNKTTDSTKPGYNTVPDGVFLTGTLVVVKGATINAAFDNDITAGGVMIPKSDSTTLTQDPTTNISAFLVLTATTEIHVQSFAYASNSGTAGSGEVQANIQSAQFKKVC